MTDKQQLRLAVFEASAFGLFHVKAIAGTIKTSQASVKQAACEMESHGMPTSGGFAEVSTTQAAWVLGVIPRHVRSFCQNGDLGRRVGGRYVIPVRELIQFAAIPRQRGGDRTK